MDLIKILNCNGPRTYDIIFAFGSLFIGLTPLILILMFVFVTGKFVKSTGIRLKEWLFHKICEWFIYSLVTFSVTGLAV